MTLVTSRQFFLLAAVALLMCTTGCGPRGREKGVRDAKEALAAGKLMLKEYPPLPSPAGHNEYVALLRKKCGVDYKVISTPGFSEKLKQEVWGWNEVMETEIERKFGADIFQQLRDEAMLIFEQQATTSRQAKSSPAGNN